MGLSTLIDTILFIFFLFIAIVAPLFDAQTCLPSNFFPDFLVDLKTTYARDNGDYLIAEKPNFFIGLIWLELLVQWPLSIANVYGILRKKSWLQTTCLIYGVCTVTAMVAILSELVRSRKASDKLLMIYDPFLGLGLLATLRGIIPCSLMTASSSITRSGAARKKRA